MPSVDPIPVAGLAGLAGVVNDNSAAYDLVLLAHVLTALVGLLAIVVAGGFALALRQAWRRGGPLPDALVRYYRPGINWVGRVLFAVPVLGIALVAMSGGQWGWSDAWVSIGLGIWLVVAGFAEAVLWPGERRLQEAVTAVADGGGGEVVPDTGAAGAVPVTGIESCRTVVATAAACTVALVVVAVLMVAKP